MTENAYLAVHLDPVAGEDDHRGRAVGSHLPGTQHTRTSVTQNLRGATHKIDYKICFRLAVEFSLVLFGVFNVPHSQVSSTPFLKANGAKGQE